MKKRGFTLIEILIVLFILGLVSTVVVYSMDVFSKDNTTRSTSEALSSRLKLAYMESVFENETLGVGIDEKGYRFYVYNETDANWDVIQQDSLFAKQSFGKSMQLQLTVDGIEQKLSQAEPMIVFKPGELPQFELTFIDESNQPYAIHINEYGEIEWVQG